MDRSAIIKGSMNGFTPQQEKAIAARNVSVALAAGAGCGKTFVLTERFLACLDPERPGGALRLDQLTAITFTERAAREMRQRIREACGKRLRDAEEKHVAHWLGTIRELDSARIATIHSYCGTLLRSHAVEAQLDPHFQVLDAAATQTLLYELIDDQLRERLADGDEKVIELIVQYGLSKLREMIGRLLGERQQIQWEQWRLEKPSQLAARWEHFWRTCALPRGLKKVSESAAAAEILQILSVEMPSNAVMRRRCEVLRDKLPRLAEVKAEDAPAALAELREATIVQGGGGKGAWSSDEAYKAFFRPAVELRETIDEIRKQAAYDAAKALPAAEAALYLLDITRDLDKAYARRKSELAALDFDDLLIHARSLLADPEHGELRKRLATQTQMLLVDEFQDTDPLQVELVRALCDGHVADGRLFFVGDHKQSIYRFRGADPKVFNDLRMEIPPSGRLPLTLNFRSQPAVIEFVNALFTKDMGPEYDMLEAHRPQLGPRPAVEFLWAVAAEEEAEGDNESAAREQDAESEPSDAEESMAAAERNRRREAEWIARRLRGMLDSGEKLVWDHDAPKGGNPVLRAVRPGDITLLFRALTNVEYYEDALRRYGIDYYLVGGHAFYAQQEIFDVVNLLRAISCTSDEVSLAGVLRSPMFGLLDETLYWLSRHMGGLSAGFWSQNSGRGESASCVDTMAPEEQARVRFAAETLGELRDIKDRVPVAALLEKALDKTGYDALLLAEFLGERKLANLHKLVNQARQFDAAGIFTLADFITQLTQFVARQPDEPLAAMQTESMNAVRLMSIHQSKGLEFPIVVVVDLDRKRKANNDGVAFTPELGPMVHFKGCVSGYDLFHQTESDEDTDELVRLLYVATTRAADYLILSTGLKDLDKPIGPWMQLLKRQFDLGSGAWIADPARILAKVIQEEPPLGQKPAGMPARHDLHQVIDKTRALVAAGTGEVPRDIEAVPVDLAARRQFSFSRLQGTIHRRDVSSPRRTEEQEEPAAAIDPLGLGTLVHAVLADLATDRSFLPAAGRPTVEALVRKHACLHLPEAVEKLDEPIDMIWRLAKSPRWEAVRAASTVYTELEFLLAWPPGNQNADARYVQGFIDCLYQDQRGGWHLLDYKTNQVSPATLAETAAGYEMQMMVYALAVEQILKRPPVEIVLHFLRANLERRFAWDLLARNYATEEVDEAMKSLETG
jgi:ATP-dependent helicase/nuclease subunit A